MATYIGQQFDWQTGRYYGPEGHNITALVFEQDNQYNWVYFNDHTRGIDGVVTIEGDVTESSILAAYDRGGYQSRFEYKELIDLVMSTLQ